MESEEENEKKRMKEKMKMEFFASVTAEEEAAKTRLDLIRIHASGVLQVSISLGVTFKLVVVVFVSAKNISISCLGFHKEPPHADIDFAGKGLRIFQLGMKNKTLFEQQSHSRHETIIAIFLCGSKALTPNNIPDFRTCATKRKSRTRTWRIGWALDF